MSNLPNPKDFKGYKSTFTTPIYKNNQLQDNLQSLKEIAKEFNSFDTLTDTHKAPLTALFPMWLYDESYIDDMDYFCFLVKFDKKENSLVAAVVKNEDISVGIVSYKHRTKRGVKWSSRAGTHPNNVAMHRVYAENEPIHVVEGIRDFLAGILLGLNIIGVPTASYRGSIPIKKDDEIIFLIEDNASMPVMQRLANECKDIAKSIKIKRYSKDNGKVDLSDICFKCNSIGEVLNEIK